MLKNGVIFRKLENPAGYFTFYTDFFLKEGSEITQHWPNQGRLNSQFLEFYNDYLRLCYRKINLQFYTRDYLKRLFKRSFIFSQRLYLQDTDEEFLKSDFFKESYFIFLNKYLDELGF